MNIEQAKAIPVQKLVETLGGRYSHTDRKGDLWFYSPFRPEEKTASFKINEKLNTWHDFGLSNTVGHKGQGSGGDVIDLWCDYHYKDRRSGIKEALQGLEQLGNFSLRERGLQHQQSKEKPPVSISIPRYKILKIDNSIVFTGLKDELQRRRISLKLANQYLKQGHILDMDTNREYTAFLFENDKGGYEVSIPNPSKGECFKTCIGPKASTRILSHNDEVNSADVFEGFWDFLSWLELKNIRTPRNHTYVLNSVSMVSEVCDKITAFKETVNYVFLFMDNDTAGYQATQAFTENLEREDFKVGSFANFYDVYKDLNEFYRKLKDISNLRMQIRLM